MCPTGGMPCPLGSHVAANPLHQVAAVTLLSTAAVAAGGLTTAGRLAATGGLTTAGGLTSWLTATGGLAATGRLTTTSWLAAVAMGPMVTKQTSLGNSTETQQESGRQATQVDLTTHWRASLTRESRQQVNHRIRYSVVKQRRRPRLPQNMAHAMTLSKNKTVIFEEGVLVGGINMKVTIRQGYCRYMSGPASCPTSFR